MKTIVTTSILLFATVSADLSQVNTCHNDPASLQLANYKEKTRGHVQCMTTASGAPVDSRDTTALNGDLMRNTFFVEDLTHVIRRKIPERVVHTKGAGAFGYFQVTHNITQYCKAKMFSEIGKRTPLFVRFSNAVGERMPDTNFDFRGFSTKFYTEEGNFDILGLNTKIFFSREPFLFAAFTKANARNAATGLRDTNMLWDLMVKKPELVPFFLYLFSGIGYQDGFIHMAGFGIHTYQVYNEKGESYFVRWHKLPKCGVKTLCRKEGLKMSSMDPDYSVRQLFNAIEEGNYPTYSLGIQVVTKKQIDAEPWFDFFDTTQWWPESKYPVMLVDDIVLNENPSNHFAAVEQAAFCPGNVVPGVLGCPDNLYVSRTFAYVEAQRYRLGTNFHHIYVNRPRNPEHSYNRDGSPPTDDNGRDGPTYFPNSFNGPVAYKENNKPRMIKINQCQGTHNFEQIAELYRGLSNDQRNEMSESIVSSLSRANRELHPKVLNLLGAVDQDLKFRVSVGLASDIEQCMSPKNFSEVTVSGVAYMCPFF